MSPHFFISRPVFASVLSIVIVIGGLVAMVKLPVAQYPEIAPPQVTVSAVYPGADAETVAQSVAGPIETQVNGVDNMLYMSSTSSPTGQMSLTVFFEIGTDPDIAQVQVQNRVSLALPLLPDAVQRTGVNVQKRSNSIMMLVAVYSPDGRFDEQYIGNYANLYVLEAIKRVPGANQSSIMGVPDLAMRLWLKPDRMAALGITPADIQRAVSQQNEQFGAGSIGQSPTGRPVELTFPVVTEGRFSTAAEFDNIILRAESDGAAIVRLRDVGRAEIGLKQYVLRASLNGRPATFIAVYQQAGSNALQVAGDLRRTLEELRSGFPQGIDYAISLDTTKFVTASIDEVVHTLAEAVVLVILVVFLFLQNFRATLIPTIAVFVSIIGTFIGMTLLGFSINLLTLFGLVLAIGIVVDDAILVVENVERNMEGEGLPVREACARAMDEITGPIVATTLVLSAVFIPVGFLGGTTGQLYKQFAITIVISVVISSFVALTLTPALSALLLKPRHGEPQAFFRWFNGAFDRLTTRYTDTVRATIRRSGLSMALLAVMLLLTLQLFWTVPGSFVPPEDQGYALAAVMMPDAASLDRTEAVTERVAEIFRRDSAVRDASAIAGYSLLDGQIKTNAGTVFVAFRDFAERGGLAMSVRGIFMRAIPELRAIKEAIVIPINPPPIPGLGTQGGFEFWIQNSGTGDTGRLEEVTREFIAQAARRAELTGLNTTLNSASRQLRVLVDRERAETLGVPVADVYSALQTLFGSLYVSQYIRYSRVWQVILQAEPEYRLTPQDIGNIYVRQRNGAMVPLSAVTRSEYVVGPDLLSRFNGFPAARITGDAAAGFSSGQALAAMEQTAREALPEGFQFAWSGQALEEKKSGGTSVVVFLFGLIMVFLILAAQYEAWSLPASVLTAIPFGIFGALVAVWLRGLDNDVYFQIGLVTLIGLSAKNAILIVEFAVIKLGEGRTPFDAAVEAARLRLRPIVMTSLAFILGAVPLAIATGAGANSRHSIGTGIIGGMIGATSLALFFVPLFFYLIETLKARVAVGTSKRAPADLPAPASDRAAAGH